MGDGTSRLDGYLSALRSRLRGLPDAEVSDIVEELRSHVRDSATAGGELVEMEVLAVLERLGTPEDLASQYVTDSLLLRAGRSRSPWLLLKTISRWATVSVAGAFALLGLLTGYALAVSLALTAAVKPFAPDRAGLWWGDGEAFSLHIGLGGGPAGQGVELLGWWIVPLGLAAGAGCFWLTMRYGRWCVRRFRHPPLSRSSRAPEGI